MRTISPLRGVLASTVVLASFSLVGCGIGGGKTLAKYSRGDTKDVMTTAPGAGTVALSGSSDVQNKTVWPVDKGDKVGFKDERTTAGGNVVAVVGDNEQAISQGAVIDRTYYLKYQAAKGK